MGIGVHMHVRGTKHIQLTSPGRECVRRVGCSGEARERPVSCCTGGARIKDLYYRPAAGRMGIIKAAESEINASAIMAMSSR